MQQVRSVLRKQKLPTPGLCWCFILHHILQCSLTAHKLRHVPIGLTYRTNRKLAFFLRVCARVCVRLQEHRRSCVRTLTLWTLTERQLCHFSLLQPPSNWDKLNAAHLFFFFFASFSAQKVSQTTGVELMQSSMKNHITSEEPHESQTPAASKLAGNCASWSEMDSRL